MIYGTGSIHSWFINTQMYNSPGILIVLLFITVGIGFKLSSAPNHQWTPDVNEEVHSGRRRGTSTNGDRGRGTSTNRGT
ncbi:hypothetical protein GLYMA_11G146100v4 [Glycine max]|uniref:NADH:quinone oxidoreductase/Mrp antiporter transmembrane domain-containing protein n=1 Tax=Glycine max TaxID=3847 RepID=A0A0R0HRS5_SOYBN|nr:hypothetical protein JHK85_032000 [Glycine max]KAH1159464.1 hypothetical protein GYH30_031261 [Glycine max]KRH29915.1 hypothetical protein GLYMA_11G146100v4 [Glycine max]